MNEVADRRRAVRMLLCCTTVVASVVFRVTYQLGSFLAGKRGFDDNEVLHGLPWMSVVGTAFGIAGLSAVGLVAALLHELIFSRKRGRKLIVEAFLVAAMVVASLFVAQFQLRPSNRYFLVGFKECVEQRANLEEIRLWIDGLDAREEIVPETEWPPCVSELSPSFVEVSITGRDRKVWLYWGGGFFHWGMVVRSAPTGSWDSSGIIHRAIDDHSCVWVDAE